MTALTTFDGTPLTVCANCINAGQATAPDNDLQCFLLDLPVGRRDSCPAFTLKPSAALAAKQYAPSPYDCKPMGETVV